MRVALIGSLTGGGAERQLVELLNQGVFQKILVLEKGMDYAIDEASVFGLTAHHQQMSVLYKTI